MHKYYRMTLIAIINISLILLPVSRNSAERKNFNLYFSFEGLSSGGGLGSAEWKEMTNLSLQRFAEKAGIVIQPVFTPKWKDVAAAIKKKKTDFLISQTSIYVNLKQSGLPLTAVATFTPGYKVRECVYTNNKLKIKNIKELKGKKAAVATSFLKRLAVFPSHDPEERFYQCNLLDQFVLFRSFLNKAGIKTLKDSGIIYSIDYPNVDSKLIALDKGLVDSAVADDFTVDMWKRAGKPFKNIDQLVCSEETYLYVFAATDRVSQGMMDKLREAALDLTREGDPEIQKVVSKLNLKVGKAGLIPITDADLKPFFDLWRDSEKNGAEKDASEVVKKLIEAANSEE